ncbi:MAG TPA: hypothetical protein VMM18_18435 [Gemmatimonadaceae bacterium]|nr:hypothetical protein [Gemmatimonadaceae bacterium]
MRSLGEGRAPAAAEWAAHAAAVALLAWMLVRALGPAGPAPPLLIAEPRTDALAALSGSLPSRVHATFREAPEPVVRDWLVALRRSGRSVSWSGDSLVGAAASVEPIVAPRGGVRVRVAAPAGMDIVIGDAAGALDTVSSVGGGATLAARMVVGDLTVAARGGAGAGGAKVAPGEHASVRDVLVLGRAGWESKFVIAALEEEGWRVTARLAVAPGAWVTQGTLAAIDTSRFAAVVAIDTVAAEWGGEIARYVRGGGGFVLAGGAAASPAFRTIAPGRPAMYVAADPVAPPDSAPRRVLGVQPITSLASDAVVLERRGTAVTAAARRVALGRVAQIGYVDTWRWRMAGGEGATEAHREWWSKVVSSVAHAPAQSGAAEEGAVDAAPHARLVDALGEPSASPRAARPAREPLMSWVLVLAVSLLIGSWGSRRLRGAR